MPRHDDNCVQDDAIKDARERLAKVEERVIGVRDREDERHTEIIRRIDCADGKVEKVQADVGLIRTDIGKLTTKLATIMGIITALGVGGQAGVRAVLGGEDAGATPAAVYSAPDDDEAAGPADEAIAEDHNDDDGA